MISASMIWLYGAKQQQSPPQQLLIGCASECRRLTKCTHKTPNQMLQCGLVSAWLETVLRTNVPIYIPAPYTGHNGLKCEDERIYLYCNSSHSTQKKKPGIIHYLLSQTAYIQSIHCRVKLGIN